MKRAWNLAPVLQIVETIPENYCSSSYLSIGQVLWLNELWLKRYIQKCTLSYVLILIMTLQTWVNHGMVKNTKTWKSWKRNIIVLQNKKILNLRLRWHILRSYCFLTELTFKRFWAFSNYSWLCCWKYTSQAKFLVKFV